MDKMQKNEDFQDTIILSLFIKIDNIEDYLEEIYSYNVVLCLYLLFAMGKRRFFKKDLL